MDQTWLSTSAWPTLALINAGLAEQKNRSRLNWFLVSLFLGPLATLLIVLWDPVPEADPEPAREGPTPALFFVGACIIILSAIPFALLAAGAYPYVWAIAVGMVVAGVAAIVVNVIAYRRWRVIRAERAASGIAG